MAVRFGLGDRFWHTSTYRKLWRQSVTERCCTSDYNTGVTITHKHTHTRSKDRQLSDGWLNEMSHNFLERTFDDGLTWCGQSNRNVDGDG
jgi:hypothetical protein